MVSRQIVPLQARPGMGLRDHGHAGCGCAFTVTAVDTVLRDLCPTCAYAEDLHRLARAVVANVNALPAKERAGALRTALYAELRGILTRMETYEREREGQR